MNTTEQKLFLLNALDKIDIFGGGKIEVSQRPSNTNLWDCEIKARVLTGFSFADLISLSEKIGPNFSVNCIFSESQILEAEQGTKLILSIFYKP